MNHEITAYHRLAISLGLSDVVLGLWICLVAVVVIVGIGWACIELSMTPEPEDRQRGTR